MPYKRIKVLHVSPSLGLGGTEKVMQFFASSMDLETFQTAVFSTSDGPRGQLLRDKNIPTFIGKDLLAVLEKFRPHVVHIHRAGWAEPGSLRPIKLAGIPLLVETNVFGHHDPSPEGRLIDRHLFVSKFCAERYEQVNKIPVKEPLYSVLYNPVDTDFFQANCPANRTFPDNVFGRISRADKGKWSSLALDFLPMLKTLAESGDISSFTYKIIGGIPEAEKFIADHALNAFVEFMDPVLSDAQIADFLNSISFLVHANDTGESFGLVIAEAMAAGLPVITHPSRGLRDNAQLELVDHGKTGLVARNTQEYAEAVRFLMSHPEESRIMGEAGRYKAKRLFRVQEVTAKLGSIYLDLLKSKNITLS